ncbi:hypothetical protein LINPERHAP1_LOCUS8039, partial [Linum perenne]
LTGLTDLDRKSFGGRKIWVNSEILVQNWSKFGQNRSKFGQNRSKSVYSVKIGRNSVNRSKSVSRSEIGRLTFRS